MEYINAFVLFIRHIGETLKYDVNFRGPLSKRSCTDVCCLFIFIVFCVAWGFIARYGKYPVFGKSAMFFYFAQIQSTERVENWRFVVFSLCSSHVSCAAINNGDLDRLLVPTDSKNRKCGVDNSVIDKPFLLFFNLEECIDPRVPLNGCKTPQVCVEKCPSTSFIYNHFNCNANTFNQIRSQLICQMEVQMDSIRSCDDIKDRIKRQDCASWYLPSNPCMELNLYCIYSEFFILDYSSFIFVFILHLCRLFLFVNFIRMILYFVLLVLYSFVYVYCFENLFRCEWKCLVFLFNVHMYM